MLTIRIQSPLVFLLWMFVITENIMKRPVFFQNLSRKFKFDWRLARKTGTLHVNLCTFMTVSRWILLRMRNVSDKSCREIKTHILCSINVFRKSYRLWDNVEKYCRTRRATDNTAHAHCVLDKWVYRHTFRICNTSCFSTAKLVAQMRLNVTL
jgi:hypothetical protein